MNSSDGLPPPSSSPGEEPDPAEIWGRRIGRALGWIGAGVLLLYLAWSLA